MQVGKIASEYDKHPVVVALLGLFERMEVAESGWQPGHARSVRPCRGRGSVLEQAAAGLC